MATNVNMADVNKIVHKGNDCKQLYAGSTRVWAKIVETWKVPSLISERIEIPTYGYTSALQTGSTTGSGASGVYTCTWTAILRDKRANSGTNEAASLTETFPIRIWIKSGWDTTKLRNGFAATSTTNITIGSFTSSTTVSGYKGYITINRVKKVDSVERTIFNGQCKADNLIRYQWDGSQSFSPTNLASYTTMTQTIVSKGALRTVFDSSTYPQNVDFTQHRLYYGDVVKINIGIKDSYELSSISGVSLCGVSIGNNTNYTIPDTNRDGNISITGVRVTPKKVAFSVDTTTNLRICRATNPFPTGGYLSVTPYTGSATMYWIPPKGGFTIVYGYNDGGGYSLFELESKTGARSGYSNATKCGYNCTIIPPGKSRTCSLGNNITKTINIYYVDPASAKSLSMYYGGWRENDNEVRTYCHGVVILGWSDHAGSVECKHTAGGTGSSDDPTSSTHAGGRFKIHVNKSGTWTLSNISSDSWLIMKTDL